MIFSKLFKKNTTDEIKTKELEANRYEALVDVNEVKHQVVDMCEQIIDAAREYEDAREEYNLVTTYLSDIQIIDDIADSAKKKIIEIATNVAKLNKSRNDFLKAEHKISDNQFAQIQELEDELPKTINRLKSNEAYLDTIKRDLNFLEGEKASWTITKEECKRQQKQLRNISILLLVMFAFAALFLILASHMLDINTQMWMIILAFCVVAIGAYVFLKYQDCTQEIKKCDVNWNHAVSLENRVKIKYVNMKNAVDYTCDKFHVNSSQELNYCYEQYADMIKQREKFRKTNDELELYNNQLVFLLQQQRLREPKVWLNYANALIDKNEMVELKHDLVMRRQKLRTRMEYNVNVMTELRSNILLHKDELGDRVEQVNKILRKIADINATF